MLLLSTEVIANIYVECYDCTSAEMLSASTRWGDENLTKSDFMKGITKDVHVINIIDNKIETYNVKLILMHQQPMPFRPRPVSTRVYTPSNIQNKITPFIRARSNLKKATNELIIPASEISNAWQVINCAFCTNNIQRYVNQSLTGERISLQVSLEAMNSFFGLTHTGVPAVYKIKLELGGYVEVKMSITAESTELKIELMKSVDRNGNTVPFKSADLKDLVIQIPSYADADRINKYLNMFYFTTSAKIGYVIIRPCIRIPEQDEYECR